MGLDTTHNCYSGSYSTFHRWRSLLSDLAGFPADYTNMKIDPKTWLAMKDHDLYPLLDHSDCDGQLSPADATRIIRGLTVLLPKIHDPRMSQITKRFIAGCQDAVAKQEEILFE